MSENSKIEWCHHTFNPWWGCSKVSEGCRNCYADALANRYGKHELWQGKREKKKGPWLDIRRWDKKARERGVRERVFVASMADIFDGSVDVISWRDEAFDLLESLTNLDILLLTKRPKLGATYLNRRYEDNVPKHFWFGTTVENQKAADERIPELIKANTDNLFLSVEPLLEKVDLRLNRWVCQECGVWSPGDYLRDSTHCDCPDQTYGPEWYKNVIPWVIVGGESGHSARPMDVEWAWDLMRQCERINTAFFFKQGSQNNWLNFKDPDEFPDGLDAREFPEGLNNGE